MKEISDSNFVLFLHIINSHGNINLLIENGLIYSQIAEIIDISIRDKYIKFEEGKSIEITKLGKKKLNELNKLLKRRNSNQWISPLEFYKIDKISDEFIYVPKLKRK